MRSRSVSDDDDDDDDDDDALVRCLKEKYQHKTRTKSRIYARYDNIGENARLHR